jgi:hypothetical protein
LLMAGSALAFLAWHNGQGGRRPVLAVVRPVAAGHILAPADVAAVRVSLGGHGLRVVPASQQAAVVGRRAAVELVPGTLLSPDQLGEQRRLAPGRAITGIALKAGQLPDGLQPGDMVMILRTGTGPALTTAADGATTVSPPLAAEARVVTIGPGRDQSGTTLVSLELDAIQAPAVATAAAAGQVSLLLVGGS